MGLFSQNPNGKTQGVIAQKAFQVQSSYKMMFDGCGIEVFVNCKKTVFDGVNTLIMYENKFPKYFRKPKPSDNLNKITKELPECEKKFVDYTLNNLERKLLNYTTDRGKINNFNKEIDIFHYYAAEFLPETVIYFEKQIEKIFPKYQ